MSADLYLKTEAFQEIESTLSSKKAHNIQYRLQYFSMKRMRNSTDNINVQGAVVSRRRSVLLGLTVVVACVLLLLLEASVIVDAFTSRSTPSSPWRRASLSSTQLFVEAVSVKSLTDHENEGTLLAESIVRWLDSEVSSETVA